MATKSLGGATFRTAASKVVMRSGRHFAQFTVVRGCRSNFFGVIRPGWDVEGGVNALGDGTLATASTARPAGVNTLDATAGKVCSARGLG